MEFGSPAWFSARREADNNSNDGDIYIACAFVFDVTVRRYGDD